MAVRIEDRTDHLGNIFDSRSKMCKHWNVGLSCYTRRIDSGWSKEEALTIKDNMSIVSSEDRTDHLGQVFDSKEEMCKYWNIYRNTYEYRIKSGWSKEEALTTKQNDIVMNVEDRTDHLGQVFDSMTKMCKYWNIGRSVYTRRIKSGWSKEEALTSASTKIIPEIDRTDHLGQVFKSTSEMCKFWNINQTTYESRLKKGLSKEEALTLESSKNNIRKKFTDHLGQVFDTKKDMCNHWKISVATYNDRIERGLSIEESLTMVKKEKKEKIIKPKTIVKDHLGNEFKTQKEMCKYWSINQTCFNRRIKEGWSLKDALETKSTKQFFDHLGNEFESLKAMCKYWDISDALYRHRISKGMTLEEALTSDKSIRANIELRTDHLGNVFKSIEELCNHYNINKATYTGRIKSGWSKEKALLDLDNHNCSEEYYRTDIFGRVFKTQTEMLNFYNIDKHNYCDRIKAGYSKEEAMGYLPLLSRRIKNKNISDVLTVSRFVYSSDNLLYFECIWNDGKKEILSKDDILNEFRKTLKKETE